jgi:hypothetical protein
MSQPSQLDRTPQLGSSMMVKQSPHVAVSKQDFKTWKQKYSFPCYGIFQRYFKMYLKLWTYFEINMKHKFKRLAMAFVCSPYQRGSIRSSDMVWHWWLTSQM